LTERILNLWQQSSGVFMRGLLVTLRFSAMTVLMGTVFGSLVCLLKMSMWRPLGGIGTALDKKNGDLSAPRGRVLEAMLEFRPFNLIATAYIEVIRGTPLLLQLYFFVFGLPAVGIKLEESLAVLIALIVNSSGYVAEIMRSGIQAVDRGQTEAARSLGLNGTQTMMKIVLPQAIKNILPSLANEFVMIVKETSLLSTFFIGDIMTQYKVISGARYLTIEPLIIIGIIYFVVTFTLSKLVALYERRLAASD